jgi:UDP-N-acetylmuramoylalanine--D-glutamate ligase
VASRSGLVARGTIRIAAASVIRAHNVDGKSPRTPPAASLAAYDPVVWIAGGLLKDATVDDLVAAHGGRLRGVVLVGRDRSRIADALSRHAPDVPVVDVMPTETVDMPDVMSAAVSAAAALAAPGDTVLLAPAAASMDMFVDYAARGDAFADAVRALGARP